MHYPDNLIKRYELDELPEYALKFFESIGKNMGALRAGGQVDLPRICTLFLNEFRSGMLGNITLENPQMMEFELKEVEQILEEKAAKKAEKKQKNSSLADILNIYFPRYNL